VTSKAPWLRCETARAISSTCISSGGTGTGCRPAATLMAATLLVGS
jgi:hypothetical protein